MKDTTFSLYNVHDMEMLFDETNLYMSSFSFDRETGYTYQATHNSELEIFRFDYAALQDVLEGIIRATATMEALIFTVDPKYLSCKPKYYIDTWQERLDDECCNLTMKHVANTTFIITDK